MMARQRMLALGLAWLPTVAPACQLKPMTIDAGVARAGRVMVSLGEADDAAHPSAWQGPLRITVGAAPACTASDAVAIIEAPLWLGDGVIYVPTYSGSNNRLYAVDVRSCRVLWRSWPYSGPTRYTHGQLRIGARTVPPDHRCRPTSVGR